MSQDRADTQDIRPIEIVILNLMPNKETTETQLMRLLSNSPLQVNVTLAAPSTYKGTHAVEHLKRFYKKFDEIKNKKFDGMIITGAPVEDLDFNKVKYWEELKQIFDYADNNVTSTIYICWGAMASLHHFYGIDKELLPKKLFGVYKQFVDKSDYDPLLKGFDDWFYMPHSRHSTILASSVKGIKDLYKIVTFDSGEPSIMRSSDYKRVFVLGHMEYDRETLQSEYLRDKDKGLDIAVPQNYYESDLHDKIIYRWSSSANLFYSNWLNYCVYQITPFDLE